MAQTISSLSEISDRYDILYCDLWGCLHNGLEPFPNAVSALQKFRANGGYVMILTNSPRPAPSVRSQLDQISVPNDTYDGITSSGDASLLALASGLVGQKIYHIGPDKDLCFFDELPDIPNGDKIERVSLEQAEGIVCTGLIDDQIDTPEDYRATLLFAKQKGIKLLCTNPDIQVDFGDRRIYCAGSIAALFTEMGGESLYFGKPHPPIYDLARNRIAEVRSFQEDRVLCVGDGINTDIQGGLGDGMDTLFITGGLAAEEFGNDPANPNPDKLVDFFSQTKITPDFVMPILR